MRIRAAAAMGPSSRAAAIAVATTAACADPLGESASGGEREALCAEVHVRDDDLVVDTGRVGIGADAGEATYVFVDAVSGADVPLRATLGGVLTGGSGEAIASLTPERLRIPPGGQRTFALVDAEEAPRPRAEGARIRIDEVRRAEAEPPLAITGVRVYRDRDIEGRGRVIVKGRLENRAEARAEALVMASFHGDDEAPLDRPFAHLSVDGGMSRPVRFVGPADAARGAIYVGPSRLGGFGVSAH